MTVIVINSGPFEYKTSVLDHSVGFRLFWV